MKKIMFIMLILAGMSYATEKFTICTEELPPYNFTKDGKITGVSTEIVEAVFKEAGIPYDIKVYPWARALKETQENGNTAVYSTGRRPDREALFKWVGELTVPKYSVFALKTRQDITAKNLDDLKKFKIGVTKGDARENYLLSKGFVAGVNVESVAGTEANDQNLKKLEIGRIDLIAMPEALASYLYAEKGQKAEMYIKNVFFLEEMSKVGYYIALNKETPDDVVKKLQSALDKLKASGVIKTISAKWHIQ